MLSRVVCLSRFGATIAIVGLVSATVSAQTISTFNGGGGTSGTNESWTTASNWTPATVPSGTGAWAVINSQTSAILRILYTSGTFSTQPAAQMGLISFPSTLASTSGTYGVQNNSGGTSGTMRFYGVNTTVEGVSKRFFLINSSTLSNVVFTQANAGQAFELFNSGAVHVTAGTQLNLSPTIRDGSGSQSLTKTGGGVLTFSGATTSTASTYSGGFVLEGGVVQFTNSGSVTGNPFGVGPLTLRSGTLRATSTAGRTIYNSVILDGTATFGSNDFGITGRIDVDHSGGLVTGTVASNSVLTIAASGSTTIWQQAMSGPGSWTKAGPGILSFSGSSELSTYSGGFVLNEGIVQWANNGATQVSTPFGLGSLTLRSGTLRSSSSTSRNINTSVILDGSVEFGSTDPSFNGTIAVNSAAGALTTTVASNSVLTIVQGGSTSWNQSVSGAGSITKAGTGLLRFSPLSTLTHSGSTVVSAGTLIMAGNLASASPVMIMSGALLSGTGSIEGPTSVLSGGTFSPGAGAGAIGLFTFGSGGVTLGGTTVMELSGAGTTRGTDYDAINLGGSLTYGGALSLVISGSLPNAAYELFKNFTSQGSTFTSINLSGFYTGSLTETAGVWSGTFGDQDITFTNATGVLAVVPEPSTFVLVGLGVVVVVASRYRRRSGRGVSGPEGRGCASTAAAFDS